MGANDITYGIRLNADGSGVKAAFNESAQAARSLSEATTQAGSDTQSALSKVEAGARKTSTALQQIPQQSTPALSSVGQSAIQAAAGLEQLPRKSVEAARLTTGALKGVENSAKQTAFAMRQLPMQMTDITVGLATGQSPFMVLMQQGGQLKDLFGGVVPAVKAVAGAVFSTTTAIAGVAAGVGLFAYQLYQGDQQIKAFNRTLEMTGGYAGVSDERYRALANTLQERVRVSAGTAREALTALASTGQFQGEAFDEAALAATRLEKATGQSAAEIVQDFSRMQSGVAKWAAEHNRQYHFITAAQYQHIKSLEDAGKTQEAATVTLAALNQHLAGQTRELGLLEGALERVKLGWAGWVETVRNLGEDTTAERLTHAYEKLDQAMRSRQAWRDKTGGMASPTADAEVAKWQAEVQRLVGEQNQRNAVAEEKARRARVEQEGIAAQQELSITERKYNRKKAMAEELAAYERAIAKASAAGLDVPSDAEQKRVKTAIAEQYRDKSGDAAAREARNQQYQAQIAAQEGLQAREQDALRTHLANIAALRQQQAITEEAAIEQRLQAQQAALDRQIAIVEQQAQIAAKAGKKGDAERYEQEAERLRAQRADAERQAQTDLTTLQVNRTRALNDWLDSQNEAIDQARFEASLVGKTADEVARLTRNRRIDLEVLRQTTEIGPDGSRQRRRGLSDEDIAKIKQKSTDVKTAGDESDAWKQGDWMAGAKQGLQEYAAQAKTTAQMSAEAFEGMADRSSSALATFVSGGKVSFKDFARSIIADLAQIYAKQLIVWAIKTATGYANGGTFSADGTTNSARGNAFGGGGMHAFALGGEFGAVLDRPTFFAFNRGGEVARGLAGESGDEGVLPLKRTRDGRLGVIASGGGGIVEVNVHPPAGTRAETSKRQDGNRTIVDVVLEAVDDALAGNVASGGGSLTAALEQTYGLNRAASGN